jgi:predicted aminopeptidase
MVVGSHGVALWLAADKDEAVIEQYRMDQQRDAAFIRLILMAREALNTLFRSDVSDLQKGQQKQLIYSELQQNYQIFKHRWGGYSGYDHWMANDLNNAKLLSVSTYQSLVAAFEQVLQDCGALLDCFYTTVEHLGQLTPDQRRQCLLNNSTQPLISSPFCKPDDSGPPRT